MFEELITRMKNQHPKMSRFLSKFVCKRTVLYAFFGVLTSILNVGLLATFVKLGVDYKIGNIITLVIVKLTAYICNKNFVFKSRCENFFALCKEFCRFVFARGITALLEYFGLVFMVDYLLLPVNPSKLFLTVLVIILNYVLGKMHVFKNAA